MLVKTKNPVGVSKDLDGLCKQLRFPSQGTERETWLKSSLVITSNATLAIHRGWLHAPGILQKVSTADIKLVIDFDLDKVSLEGCSYYWLVWCMVTQPSGFACSPHISMGFLPVSLGALLQSKKFGQRKFVIVLLLCTVSLLNFFAWWSYC